MINCSWITHLRFANMEDLDSTTKPLRHFPTFRSVWRDFYPCDFPLLHFWYFVKQFLEYMMRKKLSSISYWIFRRTMSVQWVKGCILQAMISQLEYCKVFYWLTNKYKVCSDKSRNSLLQHVVFITAGYGSKMWATMLNINLLFRLFLYISN